MDEHLHLPDQGQLSTITATIFLSYALLPYLRFASQPISFSVFGFLIDFRLNYYNILSILTAAMAAFGMDWMLRSHPWRGDKSTIPNLILPALSAAALGYPLGLLELSVSWWAVMLFGSLLLFLVFVAEYISVDPLDKRYPLALMVLSAVCYSLMLILAIVVRLSDLRLYLISLILPTAVGFFCLRILQFRVGGKWQFHWTGAVTLIFSQILIALYYWPLSPVRFGLLLLGPTYALIGTAAGFIEKRNLRNIYLEPFFIMGLIWLVGIFIT